MRTAFTHTFEVKKAGTSNCIWMPKAWGIRKGDLLHVAADIGGHVYHQTVMAKENGSRFVVIPKWWPCDRGDLIDVKITFASASRPDYSVETGGGPVPQPPSQPEEGGGNDS